MVISGTIRYLVHGQSNIVLFIVFAQVGSIVNNVISTDHYLAQCFVVSETSQINARPPRLITTPSQLPAVHLKQYTTPPYWSGTRPVEFPFLFFCDNPWIFDIHTVRKKKFHLISGFFFSNYFYQ